MSRQPGKGPAFPWYGDRKRVYRSGSAYICDLAGDGTPGAWPFLTRVSPTISNRKGASDVGLLSRCKAKIIAEDNATTKGNDTGSPVEVQVAILTERINGLTEHFKAPQEGQPLASRPRSKWSASVASFSTT